MRMTARCVLGLLTAALLAVPGVSHAVPEPLDLADAVSLSESIGTSEVHPYAISITGFDRTWIEFDETGAYEQYGHSFTKVLTDEGRDQNASVSLTYHRRYGTVEIVTARVVKADGF